MLKFGESKLYKFAFNKTIPAKKDDQHFKALAKHFYRSPFIFAWSFGPVPFSSFRGFFLIFAVAKPHDGKFHSIFSN